MSFFKKASFNNTLVIILILINVICLFFLLTPPSKMSKHGMGHKNQSPAQHQHYLAKRLNFNKSQRAKFFEINEAHHTQMKNTLDKKAELNKVLLSNVNAPDLAYDSICQSIGALSALEKKTMYLHFKEVRSICNEKQKKRFDKFIQSIAMEMPHQSRERNKSRKKRSY